MYNNIKDIYYISNKSILEVQVKSLSAISNNIKYLKQQIN